MSNRYYGLSTESTELCFQFLKGGDAFTALTTRQVTIHPTYADAVADTNIIETITTITRIAVGKYKYTAAIIATAGVYYDKIFITPESGISEVSYISAFTIYDAAQAYIGYPDFTYSRAGKCLIYGSIVDGDDEPVEGVNVSAIPAAMPAIISGTNYAIRPVATEAISSSSGYFEFYLIQNMDFVVYINNLGFRQKIRIPAADSCLLWSLASSYESDVVTLTSTGIVNPSEVTW